MTYIYIYTYIYISIHYIYIHIIYNTYSIWSCYCCAQPSLGKQVH